MSSEERQARSLALEKAYVHDVYDQIAPHFTDTRYRAWPRVKQFLLDLEPASLVADVGCGNGKYLDVNRDVMMIGSDRCGALTAAARAKNHEVVTCDNLELPFRDETFDAALSVAVIHHFATTDRRVTALKELARVLRIGGKVLITVWAMEQRHRKFDSQDVLVPWHEPVKSSSEDRASSVEREMTSTTTSDDDVLVYHAYSHISDSEAATAGQRQQASGSTVNRRRQKFRNGRGRYRSAGSFDHCNTCGNSRSSSELSSPNETCYSFVKRALQKLSSSASSNSPYHPSNKPNVRPYFYRSCRKPWVSTSMEFGPNLDAPDPNSSRNELYHQSSVESECPDQPNEDDVPIEIRHLEGYEPCMNCGSPVRETDGLNRCETHVCASCLPIDTDSSGKKSRSLGDFFNMIPKLLRVKKCEKEPLSDLHKRISTASDPREYVVKSRGSNVNGIVRSKSTVSFMSRLEEIMSFSVSSEKSELEDANVPQVTRSKNAPSRVPSLTAAVDCPVILPESDRSTNPRRYNSPADALRKLRQDVSLDEPDAVPANKLNNLQQTGDRKKTAQSTITNNLKAHSEESTKAVISVPNKTHDTSKKEASTPVEETNSREEQENSQDSHLSSYYSMPELYKLTEDQVPCSSMYSAQRQRHISFYEQAQTVLGDTELSSKSSEMHTVIHQANDGTVREGACISATPQRALVKRSLSVDTGDNSSSSHQCPRRFSASAAQGVLASALRTYCLPRSSSRGSSVKSDTSIDSEESIVSVIPRKGNSITSDTSVDSEESVISVIQRSTSEIETLVRESGLRNNISRLGSRSARASPITVLSSQTSSAESSPPQSGKNDGKFPGSGAVIDQLLQQQQQQQLQSSIYSLDGGHIRQDSSEYIQRTRRSLLRPLSDSKIEDRMLSNSFDETTCIYRSSSRQTPGSNRSSLESDDQVIKEEDEKCCEAAGNVADDLSTHSPDEQNQGDSEATGELSRTPSPIGPFKYIFDPLLEDVDPPVKSKMCQNFVNQDAAETDITNDDTYRQSEDVLNESPSESRLIDTSNKTKELPESTTYLEKEPGEHCSEKECESSSKGEANNDFNACAEDNAHGFTPVEVTRTSTEAERHEKLRKLSQRLENLGLSSELLKSFYMSSEDNEETFSNDPLSNDKPDESEQVDEEQSQVVSDGDFKSDTCSTENATEKSDEDSFVDESLRTVIHDVKNDDPTKECSGDTTLNRIEVHANNPSSCSPSTSRLQQNSDSDGITSSAQEDDKNCSEVRCEQKTDIRSGFRRPLKRSCVTIDEVECREVVSSEDTSPSSSASLEWNDFDKMDSAEVDRQAALGGLGGSERAANLSNVHLREDDTVTSPEDVNVAETVNKFNVFLDKEICVFFETPSSSIGKSASSSSNATDFSTTSDRIRGVMQREKSDDRSSKESDSDNLSKLSDLEQKSESALSEDFARRTDLDSSSSADVTSQSWCDYEGGPSSSSKAWVLDNIDEIPDDDMRCEGSRRGRPKMQREWSGEDKSLDYAQRRENLFSCAADCREMYRINVNDSSPLHRDVATEAGASGAVAPSSLAAACSTQDAANKDSDDSEVPTDILAAFVETISDLTSVFGELYPRHEGKFEDVSSDDSLEISSFERILTSKDPKPLPHPQEDKADGNQPETDRWFNQKEQCFAGDAQNSQTGANHEDEGTSPGTSKSSGKKYKDADEPVKNNAVSSNGVGYSKMSNHVSDVAPNQNACQDKVPNLRKQDSEASSSTADVSKAKLKEPTRPPKKQIEELDISRKATAKPKLLNRSSQSVCTDKFRHESVEDEFSASKTQSAPCSPRLKPRQRSVEEVLSTSKAELSRNSSLSQSTSQESLPGNESGGLMAYHRYYHVFRQGELDSLIENYVENLHIIASYYDHANWCVVAEKVQVWTI